MPTVRSILPDTLTLLPLENQPRAVTDMSTIIKAADRNQAVQSVAFNLDDVHGNAERYLTQIRQQAARIVEQAHQEAEAVRKRAEVEGRRMGEAAVDQKVDAQVQTMFGTLGPALQATLYELQQLKGTWLAHWEREAVHLATAIAARVIRRELQADPQIPLLLVREALSLAVGSQRVRILLNPQDHASLGKQAAQLATEITRLAHTEVVADPNVEMGSCRIETDQGLIDQQFASQLARIEEELT